MTLFVNPLQFGPNEDLRRYPRTLDGRPRDRARPRASTWSSRPTDAEMYPDGTPAVRSTPGPLGEVLEGASRPGLLPRRAHRGAQAAAPDPRRRRVLRREGLPAAHADPRHGARPRPRRRHRRRPDRARARRPGAVQPQPLPVGRASGSPALALSRALAAAAAEGGQGAAAARAAAGAVFDGDARQPRSTTSW